MEDWLPVCGWDGVYEVSDKGRVRRVVGGTSTYAGRIMRPIINNSGYPTVRLRHMGREAKPLIHRLVAEAFIGPIPEDIHVNHKDGNKQNPALSNLEFATCSENHIHAYRTLGRRRLQFFGETNGSAKLTGEKVEAIRSAYESGTKTQNQLADQYGVSQSMISQIVLGKRWTDGMAN